MFTEIAAHINEVQSVSFYFSFLLCFALFSPFVVVVVVVVVVSCCFLLLLFSFRFFCLFVCLFFVVVLMSSSVLRYAIALI